MSKEEPLSLQEKLCDYLAGFITQNKRNKIEETLQSRTRHISIVLEDIYQPHNASAVLRSCECLGIQDIHIIENRNPYKPSPGVAMGSNKWLSLFYYKAKQKKNQKQLNEKNQLAFQKNTADCLQSLRKKGYRIVATSPHKKAWTPSDFPIDKPAVFLFGAEESGLSSTALAKADEFIRIPMYGFTESYNLSVSAALVLSRIVERLHTSEHSFLLSESEKTELRLAWYRNILKRHDLLENRFLENLNQSPWCQNQRYP